VIVRPEDINQYSFGYWIRRLRKSLDLTQPELANRVGCSVITIKKIESGNRRPSQQIANLLADALNVPEGDRDLFLQVARGQKEVPETIETPSGLSASYRAILYHLPYQPTPFLGREVELAEITSHLAESHCRLLTLCGQGGTGKTRLAIRVAELHSDAFQDGVYFISLLDVYDADGLLQAVGKGTGLRVQSYRDMFSELIDNLSTKKILLVLDSFEHIIEHAHLVGEILQHTDGLSIIVTSLESLKIGEEWVFEVQGLAYPEDDETGDLAKFSAVQLFIENARRASSTFSVSKLDMPYIVQICRLVEGMPLGIELASAWVRTLSCMEIAQEIERNLDFLAVTRRNGPERHNSLRATYEYTWKLLSEEEKNILCRLAVFRGGFDRLAAHRVAGASLQDLTVLIEKSLIRYKNGIQGEARYEMHDLIRWFIEEKVQEAR
jgi:predicted ATPase/DNA-binding XRE family transcriptional regulator